MKRFLKVRIASLYEVRSIRISRIVACSDHLVEMKFRCGATGVCAAASEPGLAVTEIPLISRAKLKETRESNVATISLSGLL